MAEHIKKFESPSSADGHIIDNPFITSVIGGGDNIQNLVCGLNNKKLINDNGTVRITNNLNHFELDGRAMGEYYFEDGMNWYDWADSIYNTDFPDIYVSNYYISLYYQGRYAYFIDDIDASEPIVNGRIYYVNRDSSG